MRLAVAILICFLSACSTAALRSAPPMPAAEVALTEIGGVLTGETVLSGAYLLVSDLLIPEGSRLVIRAGSRIQVQPAEVTKIDPEFLSSLTELLVRGTIVVEGTATAPVVFSPVIPATSADPAWAGILLDRATSSVIRHAQIRGAETGMLLIDAAAELTDCELEKNRYGIVIQSGRPLLQRNLVSDGEGGVFVWNGAAPHLVDNLIRNNEEEGLYVDRSSHPVLSHNRAEQNAIGLVSVHLFAADALHLSGNGEAWRELLPRQEVKE